MITYKNTWLLVVIGKAITTRHLGYFPKQNVNVISKCVNFEFDSWFLNPNYGWIDWTIFTTKVWIELKMYIKWAS
jgi:hypothetical protein